MSNSRSNKVTDGYVQELLRNNKAMKQTANENTGSNSNSRLSYSERGNGLEKQSMKRQLNND